MTFKTCIVKYLPAGNNSKTLELLSFFLGSLPAGFDTEVIDLLKQPPPIFTETTLPLYLRKGYQGIKLAEVEQQAFEEFTKIVENLKKYDALVIVTPMHNFSFPGIVKSYLDSIMQYGETWYKEGGKNKGLMDGKKALVLATAGGSYQNYPGASDYLTPLAKNILGTMGYETEVIMAEKMASSLEGIARESINNAKEQIINLVNRWYV